MENVFKVQKSNEICIRVFKVGFDLYDEPYCARQTSMVFHGLTVRVRPLWSSMV